ncbi:MAG: hypothetical protein HFJ85_04815 [Oscillospiraceae bacterium]|nr:hypothetical protein [Oscillospiraceae bacterium]
MKVKKRVFLKIGAALLGTGMAAFLLFAATSFLGDPISGSLAKVAIHEYVAQHYPEREFEIGEIKYNFKFGEYSAKVSDPTSRDTQFLVSWEGNGCSDNYEYAVLDGWNTMDRLAEECAEEIKPLLSSAEGLEQAAFTVTLSNETQENGITPKPALDVSFEKEMASDFTLIIRADSPNPSIEEAARMLEAADQTLKANGYFLAEYTIDLQDSEQEDHCLLISDVTPELIEEGNLVKRFYQCESSDLPQEGEPFVRFYPIVD